MTRRPAILIVEDEKNTREGLDRALRRNYQTLLADSGERALQAMTQGGLLTITLFSNDRYLGLSFKDTGKGISADDLSRLFEPFRSDKLQGTGLGLIIVQRIMQEHGGKIEVHSQPGTGMTFTLFLPLDERRIRLLKAPRKPRTRGSRPKPEEAA